MNPGDDRRHVGAGRTARRHRAPQRGRGRTRGPGHREVADRHLGTERVRVQRQPAPDAVEHRGQRGAESGGQRARPAAGCSPVSIRPRVRSSTSVRVTATSAVGAPRSAIIVVITPTAVLVTNRASTSPLTARKPARGSSASRRAGEQAGRRLAAPRQRPGGDHGQPGAGDHQPGHDQRRCRPGRPRAGRRRRGSAVEEPGQLGHAGGSGSSR